MSVKILEGDCVETMAGMPEASVDAIVCDPPYGLEFMGKEWDRLMHVHDDHSLVSEGRTAPKFKSATPRYQAGKGMQAWHEAWAREALRVLKPGGHMLAFSGTRTYHRLACAVEDAGFEIRDMVEWFYGSGFPKSLNVGKAIDKHGGNGHVAPDVARALKEARTSRGIGLTKADRMFCDGTTNYSWFEGRPAGQRIPSGETFARICDEWPELHSYAERVAEAEREVTGSDTKARSENGKSALPTVGAKVKYETWDITASATDEAKQWDGWGSALKPAHEPIVLARKPLAESSIARQVLSTGTGAINVDGCRVGLGNEQNPSIARYGSTQQQGNNGWEHKNRGANFDASTEASMNKGRFPANLIFSHHPDCVRVGERRVKDAVRTQNGQVYGKGYGRFNGDGSKIRHADPDGMETVEAYECVESCSVGILDRQSGTLDSGGPSRNPQKYSGREYGTGDGTTYLPQKPMGTGHADKGGASRFFKTFDAEPGFAYVAKASRRERNAGLPEGMTNSHPTVKSLGIMRYLVRLISPPGGTVLDPFAGSGSTGCAAVLEGFDFIGIEREPEYIEIARRRIAHHAKVPGAGKEDELTLPLEA